MRAAATARSILFVLPQVHLLRKSEFRAQQRSSFSRFLPFFYTPFMHITMSPSNAPRDTFFPSVSICRPSFMFEHRRSLFISLNLSLSHSLSHTRVALHNCLVVVMVDVPRFHFFALNLRRRRVKGSLKENETKISSIRALTFRMRIQTAPIQG